MLRHKWSDTLYLPTTIYPVKEFYSHGEDQLSVWRKRNNVLLRSAHVPWLPAHSIHLLFLAAGKNSLISEGLIISTTKQLNPFAENSIYVRTERDIGVFFL